jgi:hypothetical protein
MKSQILVGMNSRDRLSGMMPHIEKVTQPGMKVVFLIRCAPRQTVTESVPQLPELNATDTLGRRLEEVGSRPDWQSRLDQRLVTEHKVFLALEALRNRGVEITVDVYTGSFRKVVKDYTRAGNVHLIIRRAGWGFPIKRRFCSLMAGLVSLKQPTLFPIHLSHAN